MRSLFFVLSIVTILLLSLFQLTVNANEPVSKNKASVATFAGGCFWCMEKPFDEVKGVLKTTSGYMGGHIKNPSYKQVSAGISGHIEVVQIEYDAKRVSYDELLAVFWKNIDPLDAKGQFCDKGSQYLSAVFAHSAAQLKAAEKSKLSIIKKHHPKTVATNILAAQTFYPAESYHQNYYKKNPVRYRYYRHGCGRDARLKALK